MQKICLVLGLIFMSLAGCADRTPPPYDGPPITRIEIQKSNRIMHLWSDTTLVESYEIELGFAPEGDKNMEGDGRTPEGRYYIDRRNPNSAFYLSLGINYPNTRDRAEAAALGVDPGSDIFIHGTPRPFVNQDDWTAGCIAVTNAEMREIYAMITIGTIVDIYP
jgi:murein L,D-transpeptidase YafK